MWYSVIVSDKVQVSRPTFEEAKNLAVLWAQEFDGGDDVYQIIATPTRPSIGEVIVPQEVQVVSGPVVQGHWQKEIPACSGSYHTACRDGVYAGIKVVSYHNGKLVYAGMPVWANPKTDAWGGYWWSVPVWEPPKPPAW